MKIIIVDDNKTFREGLKFYLEKVLTYEVIGMAEDGIDFLELKCRNDADVILMDIEMPRLNGIETVKKANWENQFLKFIAVTNYSDKAYLDEFLGAGFKACVFKINIYDELKDAIDSVKKNKFFYPKSIQIKTKGTNN